MTKRAANAQLGPGRFSVFDRNGEEVVATGSNGPTANSRQPVIDTDLILTGVSPATASSTRVTNPPRLRRLVALRAATIHPACSLINARLQAQAEAQQVRDRLASELQGFNPKDFDNDRFLKTVAFVPTLKQALAGPANLRRLLRQLHDLELVDITSLLVKSALVRSLPEELRIRLAAIEWQILRDEILDRSHRSENLTSCWQSARALLAKRWHLQFLQDAIWDTANQAHFFIPPPNRQFPAWAQVEWAILDSAANASLLAVLEAAPAAMSKVSLDLGHLDERAQAALIRRPGLRELELMHWAPADPTQQTDLSWLDQLSALDSLVLGNNIRLEAVPPLARSRLESLSLTAATDYAAPLEILTGLSALQSLRLKLDTDAAGLPAGLHRLLLEPGRILSDPEKKLLQSLTALEIQGKNFDLQGVLDRLPNLESLMLPGSTDALGPLTRLLASPACKLRSLTVNQLPRKSTVCNFLNPLKSGGPLQQLSLSRIWTGAGVNLLATIISALDDLSELSLSFEHPVAVLKDRAVAELLEKIGQHPGLSKVALSFVVSIYDEEAAERLNAEITGFRKKKSLMQFTCTVNDETFTDYNWKI